MSGELHRELNKCVWMWAGLLTYRLCDRNYQCEGCPVEALFHPESAGPASSQQQAAGTGPGEARARGLSPAPDRFQDPQHLWMRILPRGSVQIGLDPMAARLLGGAARLSFPRLGALLRRGEKAVTAHLDGGTVSFASPVAGEVVRVHEGLSTRMRFASRHPYTRGWLLILKAPRLERQLSRFVFGRGAGFRLAREWSRFQEECVRSAAGAEAGLPVLPDGGELDLARFHRWAGSGYPARISRWIGAARLRRLPDRSDDERTSNPDGAAAPPEER